jgi:hypothetical protein
MYVPANVAAFDEHRNSSRVWPVPSGAAKEAARASAAWRERDPAAYQWVVDGHPHLTEADHLARFGEPFKARPRRVA